jgi:hypothetical protein
LKAHFIASGNNLSEDIDLYRKIINILEANDVNLTRKWVEPAYNRSVHNEKSKTLWRDVYQANLDAVTKADIVIAEISRKSFLVGFQVAVGLQQKKPILLLSSHDAIETAIGASMDEEIIKLVEYNDKNLKSEIVKFINLNKPQTKDLKFNFFINRKILNYLNWASMHTGDTKSEIIRKVLIKEINDSEFEND